MNETLTPQEKAREETVRAQRRARYDSHMNRHGHYSMSANRNHPRSPILDEILASGQSLASNYPANCVDAVQPWHPSQTFIEPVHAEPVNTPEIVHAVNSDPAPVNKSEARKLYRAEWMRKRRAEGKA